MNKLETKVWFEAYISLGEDEGTMTIKTADTFEEMFGWYYSLPSVSVIDDVVVIKTKISADSWSMTTPDSIPEKLETIF